jgi:hypothetical protein
MFIILLTHELTLFFSVLKDLADFGFTKLALDRRTSELSIVDECGCIWNCTLQFEEGPHPHFIIGGGWNNMARGGGLRLVTVSLLVLHILAGMRSCLLWSIVIRIVCCLS